jgi:hypothetical protein
MQSTALGSKLYCGLVRLRLEGLLEASLLYLLLSDNGLWAMGYGQPPHSTGQDYTQLIGNVTTIYVNYYLAPSRH